MVRTRFAPSPTGYLHIGGVRTALFNWLFSRRHGGQFLLRIDDTDQERNVESALAPILHGFRWLGIDWDEGPEVGGPFAPYYQSQRLVRYQDAVQKLLAGGFAYRDFAMPDELKAEREQAEREKRPFLYSRRWMAETEAQAKSFEAQGRQGVVRLKIPREGKVLIRDHIRGDVEFDWAREQDHVVQRADGTCLYHLASVVDDFDFQITHVIRAEEHLSNTPRQVFIAQSLGYPLPEYAHLPYVAEPGSKNKLSKRKLDKYLKNRDFALVNEHGQAIAKALGLSTTADTFNPVIVDFYEQVGYLPDAIINYLMLLGWSLDDRTEFFSRQQMIDNFSLERVTKSPASFDPKKLWAFQDHYMQQLPVDEKVDRVLPFLIQKGAIRLHADVSTVAALSSSGTLPVPMMATPSSATAGLVSKQPEELRRFLARIVEAAGNRLKVFGDILSYGDFFFLAECQYDKDAFDAQIRKPNAAPLLKAMADVLESLTCFDCDSIESAVKQFVDREKIKIGNIIHALRVATTGRSIGPGLYECLSLLGQEESVSRIRGAVSMVNLPMPPAPTTAAYEFHNDQPITLFDGPAAIVQELMTIEATVGLKYYWRPSPRVTFSANVSGRLGMDLATCELDVPRIGLRAAAHLTSQSFTGSNSSLVTGTFDGEVAAGTADDATGIQYVIFHVPNFHEYLGGHIGFSAPGELVSWSGRLELECSGWAITLDQVKDIAPLRKLASENRGYAITHIGRVRRKDAAHFSVADARVILSVLRTTLSFARGLWTAPMLSVGYKDGSQVCWRDWSAYLVSASKQVTSWFPIHRAGVLQEVLRAIYILRGGTAKEDVFRIALDAYVAANSNLDSIGVEGSLQFVRTGLSALAFSIVPDSGQPMTNETARKGTLSEAITACLAQMSVSPAFPAEYSALRLLADRMHVGDGPSMIEAFTNLLSCMNPENRQLFLGIDLGAKIQLWRLATWYLELSMLWHLGYRGTYHDRTAMHGFTTDVTDVPWLQ